MELGQAPTLVETIPMPAPTDPAVLMAMAFRNADLGAIIADRTVRGILDPTDAAGLMDLALIAQFQGRREAGLLYQSQALSLSRLYRYPAGRPDSLRLLMFAAPGDLRINTPIELVLHGRDVSLFTVYLRPDEPLPDRLPDHDLAFVGVSEFDATRKTLARLAPIAAGWPRPVLNAPGRILDLARDRLPARLEGVQGLLAPPTRRVSGTQLAGGLPPGLAFPVIVRPVGSHGGDRLDRVSDAAALAGYLASALATDFFIAPFVDTSVAGQYRKYRIALIGGQPYLCHLAIAAHWMVNYQNAGMDHDPAKREEEHRAFATFDVFVERHAQAFEGLARRIGLDYVVLDCAEARDGRLLLFEADNAGVIHDLDPPELFPYKAEPMRRAFDAFEGMLRRRVGWK